MAFSYFSIDTDSKKTVSQQIEEAIENQIITGQLQPGDRIPTMRTLAKELHCGIVSVNRAITRLHTADLLRIEKNQGVYVADLESKEISDMQEFKILNQLEQIWLAAKESGMSESKLHQLLTQVISEDTEKSK